MDSLRFSQACEKIINKEHIYKGIGTLGEKTLHAVLKAYFEPHEENHEIKLGNYIADIVGENGIIEIQTQSFNALRSKLEFLLNHCSVTVVYPIAKIKYLSWIDTVTGERVSKRKSPKKGTIYDIFKELYKIKYILDNPNIRFCLVMLEIEELRYLNGWSRDKKKGSVRYDRIPLRLIDEIYLSDLNDYLIFIPDNLPENFTSYDFSEAAQISRRTAQIALNILNYLNLIIKTGKKGRSIIYCINNR